MFCCRKSLSECSKGARNKNLLWNIQEDFKINNTYPRTCKLTIDNFDIDIIFLKHSSKYYSWEKWHEYISSKINTDKVIANS